MRHLSLARCADGGDEVAHGTRICGCGRIQVGGRRCRRRGCVEFLTTWLNDVHVVLFGNLRDETATRLVVVTAPGEQWVGDPTRIGRRYRLRWDAVSCLHDVGDGACSGTRGCRVVEEDAQLWEATRCARWTKLIDAIRKRMARKPNFMKLSDAYIAFVDEDQLRGVMHRNIVMREGPEAALFHALLVELAADYGFGFVQLPPETHADEDGDREDERLRHGLESATYLSSYLVGREKGDASLMHLAKRTGDQRRVMWLSPTLTARTHTTMTAQRHGRRLWAALSGRCERRELRTTIEVYGRGAVPQVPGGCWVPRAKQDLELVRTRRCEVRPDRYACWQGRVYDEATGEVVFDVWRDVREQSPPAAIAG